MISDFYAMLKARLRNEPDDLVEPEELGYVLLLCHAAIERAMYDGLRNRTLTLETIRNLEQIAYGRLVYAASQGIIAGADLEEIHRRYVLPAIHMNGVSLVEWRRRFERTPWVNGSAKATQSA